MKILNSNSKNFDKNLDSLLLQRKKKVQSNSVSVSSIIKDVRKNGDEYEINLIFDNNAYIALTTETIEVRLEDQN